MDKPDFVDIGHLHPTQITVGMREVELKMKEMKQREKDPDELHRFMRKHRVPVVLGPKRKLYVIDHHHLGRACWELKIPYVPVDVMDDFSDRAKADFWQHMRHKSLVHSYDSKGEKRRIRDLPWHVSGLVDDPYRSLAGFVRNDG
jgi:hypothetical protein